MKNNKGFTLIEMLIVIAIIAILSGIVLVGVSGFQASARDARRIADIRNTQNLLELYYTQCGHYPGDDACGSVSVSAWDAVVTALGAVTNTDNVPTAPAAGGKSYFFYSDGTAGNSTYYAAAELEKDNAAATENTHIGNPGGGINCGSKVYCVTSL